MIKVLCLNDDNHADCFLTENEFFSNAGDFMRKKLLKPHNEEFVVKYVYCCDPPEALNDEDFDDEFDVLNCHYTNREDFIEIFNKFWEGGDEYVW